MHCLVALRLVSQKISAIAEIFFIDSNYRSNR
nr:MAG TPA: hypothetical protein [Caudoviricetes sp.]